MVGFSVLPGKPCVLSLDTNSVSHSFASDRFPKVQDSRYTTSLPFLNRATEANDDFTGFAFFYRKAGHYFKIREFELRVPYFKGHIWGT